MELHSVGTPALWAGFIAFVLAMLALDLGVFHRKAHTIAFKEALGWTIAWIGLAFAFNGFIYYQFGSRLALEFATGYVLEKALSVDNIFVILLIFTYFRVPNEYQHRVLFWGIIGALVMRAIFIILGAALLAKFHWIIYLFGAFLIFTGIKMLFDDGGHSDPSETRAYKFFRRIVPSTATYHGQKMFVIENGKRLATPLFLVLLMIEFTDLVFAVDSIPAIFAVTSDPFIVFTSNIFAILGLRSLFFVLSGVMDKFHRLKLGLALVLIFVGIKMAIMDYYKIDVKVSLLVIAALIGGSIAASLIWPKKPDAAEVVPPVQPAEQA
jgi:tellurite resistance protein TerC